MQKQLKKAFSSIIRFPKISAQKNNISRININTSHYKISKKDTFLTMTTDDMGFAKLLNHKIDCKINAIKQLGVKPWEKSVNNNIYIPYWTSNKKIMRNLKKNLNIEADSFNSLDINTHKKFFRGKTESIFNCYYTAKNYKFKNELKKKYTPLNTNTESIISNTKNLCFNNFMLDILENERKKINSKEIGYMDALKNEDILLNKDIENFENYKERKKMKLKNLENELLKKINENGVIFELMKQKSHDQRALLDEIKKTIKNIIRFKNYASFIFRLLGIDNNAFEKCDFGENKIMSNTLNESGIEQIIKKIYVQKNKIFDKTFDDITEELNNDPLKIYTIIKVKEKMILKLLADKENINFENIISLKDYKKQIEAYENKYNTYMNEYLMYLKEYEEELKKSQLIEPNKKMQEFNKYLINLFYEIKKHLIKDEKPKKMNQDLYIYTDLVIPSLRELKNKEILLNKLIKQMEGYENNDKILFSKFVNEAKLYNKAIKFREEKESLRNKDIERRRNIAKKINQIIITGRYKYNLPITLNRIKSFSKGQKLIRKNNNI